MSTIKTLASDSIIYGVGTAFTKSLGLLVLPIYTKYLSPEEYGVLALILLSSALIQPILTLGLNTSMGISYFKSNSLKKKSETVWSSFILLLLASIFFIFISFFFLENISLLIFKNKLYAELIFISIIFTCINVLSTPFMLKIQFEKQVKTFVVISFLSSIILIVSSIYFVVFLEKGMEGMILGQLIGSIFLFAIFLFFGKKDLNFLFDLKIIKSIFILGYPLIPSSLFLLIILQSNRYILEWTEGLNAVGIYSIGFSFGMLMNVFVSGFTQAWYPYFMNFMNKQDTIGEKFANILYLYVGIFGFILLLFFIFAKVIVSIFVSIDFYEAYKVIGLIAMSQFFIGIFSIFTPSLYYNNEVNYVSVFQGVVALLSVPINFLFIKYYGFVGAGVGLAISTLLLPVFQILWNRIRKYKKIEYELLKNVLFFLIIIILCISVVFIENYIFNIILVFSYIIGLIINLSKIKLRSFT